MRITLTSYALAFGFAGMLAACSGTSFSSKSGNTKDDKNKQVASHDDDDDSDDDDDDQDAKAGSRPDTGTPGEKVDCSGLDAEACKQKKNPGSDKDPLPSYREVVCAKKDAPECADAIDQATALDVDNGSEIVVIDCSVDPTNAKCAGLDIDDGSANVRRFTMKPGTWLDGLWNFQLNFETGQASLVLGGSYAGGHIVLSVERGKDTQEIELRSGMNVTIPGWKKACGANPVGWQAWQEAYPGDRDNPPVLNLVVNGNTIVWTGDDDKGGRPGAVVFPNLDFGLKYTCP